MKLWKKRKKEGREGKVRGDLEEQRRRKERNTRPGKQVSPDWWAFLSRRRAADILGWLKLVSFWSCFPTSVPSFIPKLPTTLLSSLSWLQLVGGKRKTALTTVNWQLASSLPARPQCFPIEYQQFSTILTSLGDSPQLQTRQRQGYFKNMITNIAETKTKAPRVYKVSEQFLCPHSSWTSDSILYP